MGAKENPKRKIKKLGNYLVQDRLGQGGMGIVYKATDTNLNRPVALKVLASKFANNENFVGRFLREGRTAALLNHPNIVRAYDVGKEGNYYFFAMEYVEGRTLQQRLKVEKQFSEQESIRLILQVADALNHAAEKSIIHRDVKPDNVMQTDDGRIKLLDLGLAKATDDDDATITQAGRFIGTPYYSSPEQIRGEADIDCRTDIYSLGIMLYRFTTGSVPFKGETTAVISEGHLQTELPDPLERNPNLSDGVCLVIRKMTEKARENRYETQADVIEDLESVLEGNDPIHAHSPKVIGIARSKTSNGVDDTVMGAKPTTSYLTLAVGTSLTAVTLFCVALLLFPSHETVTPTTTSTSSIETTTSTTIPLSSLNVSPEGVAGEQYEAVRKYIGSHPNEYRNNLSRLKQLVPLVEDTSFARKTESLRALVRYEYDAAVGRAAQTIENSLSELVNEDRFSDALKLLDGDMQGLGQDIRIRIQAEHVPRMKTAVLDAASKRADSLMARAAENAAAGEHNAATELLDRIETFNIPSLTKAATQQKERMRREQAMRKQESLDSRQMLRTVFDEVRSLASRREYAAATAQTDSVLRQPLMSDRADELRALQTVVSTASRVYSAAIAGLKRQIGKRWVINGNKGTIVGVDDTTISVAFGQAETRESISDISSHKLEAYARLSGVKETLTNASLSAFWSLCPEEDSIAKAQALARLASKRAEDIEAVTTVLKHFDAGGQSLNNTPEAEATKVKSKSRSFSLFSDERKDGWIFVGDGKFSLSRGVAKPDGGAGVWYFAQRTFEDFVLRVEYLQTKPGNNSGILFRLQDLDGSLRRAARNGYEVQIGLDGETKRSTGSIYGRAAARRAKTVSGRWNDLELVCIGETVFVRINDKPVTKYSGLQFRKGFVGLQNYANEQVWFRDLRLLELSEDLKKHLDRLNREFED